MTDLISYLKRAPSVIVIVLLIVSVFFVNMNLSKWSKKNVIDWDVTYYYCYLPATFIKKDLSLKFFNENRDYYTLNHQYIPLLAPNGGYVIKTTMGMAVMYLPFFAIAHVAAKVLGYEADGFSEPYQCLLQFSGLFYMVIGLIFLRKLLLLYFSEKVTAITLLCVIFGSNLFYYASVHGAMSHSPGFCLGSLFIWYGIKWLKAPNLKITLILGFILGMLLLIRPINILMSIFFIFYDVNSLGSIKERIHLYIKKAGLLSVMALCVFLCLVPQLLYWKWITGHFFFNSYVGEQFFWGHPHIIEGLFGFRKGWLLYSPVMWCSVIGMAMLFRDKKEFSWPIPGLFCIYCYVIWSWWCWWYGGAYGMRAMIDIYPFLIIPFAVFVNRMEGRRIVTGVLLVLTFWNCFRMFQYRRGVIHYDSMTKEAFIKGLFKTEKTPELDKYFRSPDYAAAMRGNEASKR